jgi:hypothetical protein
MCGWTRTVGPIKTISVLALLAVAALSMAVPASATPLEYGFNTNNQGWLQSQDNGSTVAGATFQASGGNPGGRLTAKDTGQEGGCATGTTPCDLLTFISPIVPKLGANYGGTGSFDLRSSVNPDFPAELLLLPTGPNYLDGLIPESIGTTYHHLSIPLNETANWAVCPYAGGACSPPSQTTFMTLIGASDQIAVIVDVGPDGTGETYDLDNVVLTEGGPLPPPPPSNVPPKKKHSKCKKKHGRKTAKSSKKKKCKKKRRSAVSGLRG